MAYYSRKDADGFDTITDRKRAKAQYDYYMAQYNSLAEKANRYNAYKLITIQILTLITATEQNVLDSVYYMSKVENTESEFKIGPNFGSLVQRYCRTLPNNKPDFNETKSEIRQVQKNLDADMFKIGDELDATYNQIVRLGFGAPKKVDISSLSTANLK